MIIYPSTKVRPYVYFGYNPITGEFYIGYREKNVSLNNPSHIDLFEYRTSSDVVKTIFDQMIWVILAEFETGDDAFDFEQQLIAENWDNPLLLNKHYQLPNGKGRFKNNQPWNKGLTKETDKRVAQLALSVSAANKGKPTWNKGTKGMMPVTWNKGLSNWMSEEHKNHSQEGLKRQRLEHPEKCHSFPAGHTPWNKGLLGWVSDEQKQNQKLAVKKYRLENPEKAYQQSMDARAKGNANRLLAIQKKTLVDGIEYPSATIAAKELGLKKITLIKRIKSKNCPTYQYVGEKQ